MNPLPATTRSPHRLAATALRLARAGFAIATIGVIAAVVAAGLYTEATRAPDQP